MADAEAAVVGDVSDVVDGGPGLVYMPFVVMEDLLDKLKLLNYEEVRESQRDSVEARMADNEGLFFP